MVDHGWINISGNESLDTLQVGPITVDDYAFVDGIRLAPPEGVDFEVHCYEAVLSLAPSTQGSQLHGRPLFVHMIDNGILAKNMFALHLREPMEISLGMLNRVLIHGDMIVVPLTNETGRDITGSWQTRIDSIALGNHSGVQFSLDGTTAAFSTRDTFIQLPDDIVWALLMELDFIMDEMSLPPYVPCGQRSSMPDIIFTLAGQDLTLTPYDYTLEWILGSEWTYCVSAMVPSPIIGSKEVILGSSFLRPFYSVFDLDNKSIGCKLSCTLTKKKREVNDIN
jgi:saccharopepsin